MGTQVPLQILSLDGGGVKGISSLYMLKELMAQVKRQNRVDHPNEPLSALRPCDVFDLICGTSTGGLIALMLGRLEMVLSITRCFHIYYSLLTEFQTIDDAITQYLELSQTIFTTMSKAETAKFDHVA